MICMPREAPSTTARVSWNMLWTKLSIIITERLGIHVIN